MKQLNRTRPKWHIRYLKTSIMGETWPYATCFRILTKWLRASKIPSSCDNTNVSTDLEATPLWTVIITGEFISQSKQYEASDISSKSNNYQHESVPYREGQVVTRRVCCFYEPFNASSGDIYTIYHFETSQKHSFSLEEECRKALLVLCYFLTNFEVKNNKSLFCSLFEDGFCDVKLLMREPYQQCTHRLLWVKIRHAFCPPTSCLCVFLHSINPMKCLQPLATIIKNCWDTGE